MQVEELVGRNDVWRSSWAICATLYKKSLLYEIQNKARANC